MSKVITKPSSFKGTNKEFEDLVFLQETLDKVWKPEIPEVLYGMVCILKKPRMIEAIRSLEHYDRTGTELEDLGALKSFYEYYQFGAIDLDRLGQVDKAIFDCHMWLDFIQFQWRYVEFHFDILALWETIFSTLKDRPDDYVSGLPEGKFKVYRGGTGTGLAWTTNKGVAEWFRTRFGNSKRNKLWMKEVTKDDCLWYSGNDYILSEHEVVLDPDSNLNIHPIKVTFDSKVDEAYMTKEQIEKRNKLEEEERAKRKAELKKNKSKDDKPKMYKRTILTDEEWYPHQRDLKYRKEMYKQYTTFYGLKHSEKRYKQIVFEDYVFPNPSDLDKQTDKIQEDLERFSKVK